MRVLIDADACPDLDLIIECIKPFRLEIILFCDSAHSIERETAKTVIVSKGMDAVDFFILKHLQIHDLVVTQDYGLAAIVLAKKGLAIHPDGWLYTPDNIDGLLMQRHLHKQARKAGYRSKGSGKRSQQTRDKLIARLNQVLQDEGLRGIYGG